MCVVGAMTARRPIRPSPSIRWAMCRPKVVLPAAGVAEARNAGPAWPSTRSAASRCHARSGRSAGQGGSVRAGREVVEAMSEGGKLEAAAVGITAPRAGSRTSAPAGSVDGVDQHLKVLADASMAVAEAEEAVGEGTFLLASERLDAAREALAELRSRWPAMTGAERRVVGGAARPVRERLDVAAARVPRVRAVSEMAVA